MQRRDHRRTGSDLPGLDLAERQSWQPYLDAVLRFDAALNRVLNHTHRLSVIDLRVLDILTKSADGSARMGDLAGALAVTPRQMTKRIGRLEERGLVRRGPDPQDRRGVVAIVTDDGRAMVDEARVTYAQGVQTDPWEAAGAALKNDQIGVSNYDGDWDPHGRPSYVDTPRFFHDQIAKGGSRDRRRTISPLPGQAR